MNSVVGVLMVLAMLAHGAATLPTAFAGSGRWVPVGESEGGRKLLYFDTRNQIRGNQNYRVAVCADAARCGEESNDT